MKIDFLVINSFVNVTYNNFPATFCTNLSVALEKIIFDMRENNNFRVGNLAFWGTEELHGRFITDQELVSQDEVLKYLDWCVSYKVFSPDLHH